MMNSSRWFAVMSVLTGACLVQCSNDKAGTNPAVGSAAGTAAGAVSGAPDGAASGGVSAPALAGATGSGVGTAAVGGSGESAGTHATPTAGATAGAMAMPAAGTSAGAAAGTMAMPAAGTSAGAAAGTMAMPTAGTSAGAGGGSAPIGDRLSPEAVLIGVCEVIRLASDPEMCTGLDEVLACGTKNCGLDACTGTCQEFLTCAMGLEDPCMGPASCDQTSDCNKCMTDLQICTLATTCRSMATFTCASTEAGGACGELESCCMMQTDPVGCMGWLEGTASLMGDAGCAQLINDPDFVRIYLSDPACGP